MNKNEITLTVVVAGNETQVTANQNAPLHTIIPEALREAEQAGPPERWQVNDENGTPLDLNRKIEEFKFGPTVKLFMGLKAGIGG